MRLIIEEKKRIEEKLAPYYKERGRNCDEHCYTACYIESDPKIAKAVFRGLGKLASEENLEMSDDFYMLIQPFSGNYSKAKMEWFLLNKENREFFLQKADILKIKGKNFSENRGERELTDAIKADENKLYKEKVDQLVLFAKYLALL
jgi:hypothetical protein